MKKLIVAAVMALGALVGVAAHAETKVAVFDAQEVLNNTGAAKRAVKDLTAKRNAAQDKINALEKPLIEKQKKLREQQAVMAPDKFAAAKDDFAKDLEKFRAEGEAIQTDLDKENAKVRKQISDAVRTVVEQIAKEKGYDLIVPKNLVFFSSTNVPDISDEVLARANKVLDK